MDLRGTVPKKLRNPGTSVEHLKESLRDTTLAIKFFTTKELDEIRLLIGTLSEQERLFLYNDVCTAREACEAMRWGLDYLKRSAPLTKN